MKRKSLTQRARRTGSFAKFADMSVEEVGPERRKPSEIGSPVCGELLCLRTASDARGAFGFPNLTDDDWIWGASLDQIRTT